MKQVLAGRLAKRNLMGEFSPCVLKGGHKGCEGGLAVSDGFLSDDFLSHVQLSAVQDGMGVVSEARVDPDSLMGRHKRRKTKDERMQSVLDGGCCHVYLSMLCST